MKRLIAGVLLLLFAAIGVFLWRQNLNYLLSSQIAPADCLVYIELPNLIQTAKRWPDTALSQILEEPSVQNFLTRPVSKIPLSYQRLWASIGTLRCSALFFAVTDPRGESWICGFQTSVDQKVWRSEISALSSSLFGRAVHEVAADFNQTGPEPGEAEKDGALTYCVKVGSWILLSHSTNLLVDAIRSAKMASGGLRSSKLFQECQANVKRGYDILCFVRGKPSVDLSSSGLRWRFNVDESQDHTRAVLAATTIDGMRLRDTIFTSTNRPAPASPLDRKGMAMTNPTTIGYLASSVNLSEVWRWGDQLPEEWPFYKSIRDYMGEVKSLGIDWHELDTLLSNLEIIVDRDPHADSLNGAFSLGITDPEKFQHLIDQIVLERFPDRCRKTEVASVPAYVMKLNENISIVAGLIGRQFLFAWSRSEFAELVHRFRSHNPGLENNDQFKAMAKLVTEPADLFVYVDAKAGFESLYNASRPMLVFGVALIPMLNKYIDAMAFPETGEVSKHLSPIVLSRQRVARGVVDESVGPITAYEALVLIAGGAVALGLMGR